MIPDFKTVVSLSVPYRTGHDTIFKDSGITLCFIPYRTWYRIWRRWYHSLFHTVQVLIPDLKTVISHSVPYRIGLDTRFEDTVITLCTEFDTRFKVSDITLYSIPQRTLVSLSVPCRTGLDTTCKDSGITLCSILYRSWYQTQTSLSVPYHTEFDTWFKTLVSICTPYRKGVDSRFRDLGNTLFSILWYHSVFHTVRVILPVPISFQ